MHGPYDTTIGYGVNFTDADYSKEIRSKNEEYFNTELNVDDAVKIFDSKYKSYLETLSNKTNDNEFSL